jgi:hypothetical protein
LKRVIFVFVFIFHKLKAIKSNKCCSRPIPAALEVFEAPLEEEEGEAVTSRLQSRIAAGDIQTIQYYYLESLQKELLADKHWELLLLLLRSHI